MRIAFISMVAILSACSSVSVKNDDLESRTSTALNLPKGSFTISNRVDSGVRTDYTVTAGKSKYACYVTGSISVMGRNVSDAICTGSGKSAPGKPAGSTAQKCNDLLKAAGKC